MAFFVHFQKIIFAISINDFLNTELTQPEINLPIEVKMMDILYISLIALFFVSCLGFICILQRL